MSNKYCLNPDEVIRVNASELRCPVGGNLLDRGKLESALATPMAAFGGVIFYPTPIERASVLLHGLCKAHAFTDGNKRTAWLATVTYLDLTGFKLQQVDPAEVTEFVVSVATQGERDLVVIQRQLACWLR